MPAPFTPARVLRFLLLIFLALTVLYLLFVTLSHTRAHQSVAPQSPQSLLQNPQLFSPEPKAST